MTVASFETTVRVFDAVRALAFIGDLSMGQPTDHSPRTAWLAARIAREAGLDDTACEAAREASLLRWSGCTANAAGFAAALGDDVASREAMLAARPGWSDPLEAQGGLRTVMTPLAQIHCEVSGEVARLLGLGDTTQATLRHIFENWDGTGLPDRLAGQAVPQTVFAVALAGDLETLTRVYGVEQALVAIAQRADIRYPSAFVRIAAREASHWVAMLDEEDDGAAHRGASSDRFDTLTTPAMDRSTPIEWISEVIDLKLPWMTGFSRAVAQTAADCADRFSLDAQTRARLHCAGLIHGIGRSAIPNAVWNVPTRLSSSAWEKVRLVPYWTARAGNQTGQLADAALLASYAYERLDGSGYFRGVARDALSTEARILSACVAWVALRSTRPWREAMSADQAARVLRDEAARGRFDIEAVEALVAAKPIVRRTPDAGAQAATRLSAREIDVLRSISKGASNKEVARELDLSPSTIRTHVENVFRKLECSTRAAATLKAAAMGVL
ncbi:HD domain-containing phosphohydrolase [Pararobbsia silviterrae]|nr:HD domain-containing phosphohydrolase [Pararobbsia silviterrae]